MLCSYDENHKMLWVHMLHFKVKLAQKSLTLPYCIFFAVLFVSILKTIEKNNQWSRWSVDSVFLLDKYRSEEMDLVGTKLQSHLGNHHPWDVFAGSLLSLQWNLPSLHQAKATVNAQHGQLQLRLGEVQKLGLTICTKSASVRPQGTATCIPFFHIYSGGCFFKIHSADPTCYSVS